MSVPPLNFPQARYAPSLGQHCRMLVDPEFAVRGIEAKVPGPFTREIPGFGLCYVNYAQVFVGRSDDPAQAVAMVKADVEKAVNFGIQRIDRSPAYISRFTGGLEFLEEFVGAPIDPAFCVLAVLQPFTLKSEEPAAGGITIYEARMECGLDIKPRRKWRPSG